ncbi:hypothetical protein SS05631_a47070 (plasmid) [Sinorhizobium sp. CCBAU 05631]|nr:hypothetical protein SS05631_a47070 [Sinorhizobium sp. CCBAU 05631]
MIAVAQIGPMPGTFWSRRTTSLCLASAAIDNRSDQFFVQLSGPG